MSVKESVRERASLCVYVCVEECGRMRIQERCFLLGLCLLGGVAFSLTATNAETQVIMTSGKLRGKPNYKKCLKSHITENKLR